MQSDNNSQGLIFIEPTHEYRYNGVIYPSVTQILRSAGKIDTTWYKKGSSDIGTTIHQCAELIEFFGLSEVDFYDRDKAKLKAWKNFILLSGYEAINTEFRVFDPIYHYAGSIDRVCNINGKIFILDIKSGQKADWHGLQLAAYLQAYMACTGCGMLPHLAICYLKTSGNFELKTFTGNEAQELSGQWLAIINKYNNKVGKNE